MNLNELKVVVRLKAHERVVHETFKLVYKPWILEKVAIDFSAKKIRGSFQLAYAGRKSAEEAWVEGKIEKHVDWFEFDDPNISVELQIADKSSITILK
jgi:hypothetical protein